MDAQVDETVPRDLIEHVIKKTDARGQIGLPSAIEVDANLDLRFFGVAADLGDSWSHG